MNDGFEDVPNAQANLSALMASSAGIARMSSSCFFTVSTSAFGRSILLMTDDGEALLERQVNHWRPSGPRRPEPHLRPARRLHKRPGCGRLHRRNDARSIEQIEPVIVTVSA
jgi:hypothetical protein